MRKVTAIKNPRSRRSELRQCRLVHVKQDDVVSHLEVRSKDEGHIVAQPRQRIAEPKSDQKDPDAHRCENRRYIVPTDIFRVQNARHKLLVRGQPKAARGSVWMNAYRNQRIIRKVKICLGCPKGFATGLPLT